MRLGAILFLFLAVLTGGLSGQIPEGVEEGDAFRPHPEAQRAIGSLYSPFCPGFMLEVCTARESIALRDSIQYLAYQGWSSSELVEWMLGNYGDQYRAVPLGTGAGLWAWLLPPLGLVGGIVVVTLVLRRLAPSRRPEEAGPEGLERGHPEVAREVTRDEEDRLRMAIREIELSEDPSF